VWPGLDGTGGRANSGVVTNHDPLPEDPMPAAETATADRGGRSRVPRIPTHAEAQADPETLRAFNAAVVEEFVSTGGRVGGPFADSNVLLLTMTGARSGQRRQTPLEYFTVDDRVLIVGTRGGAPQHPAWVHNLRATPSAHVAVGTESYGVVAEEITGDQRDELWARVVALCPRINDYPKPERVIPVFELHRADA
jgi:deazaflavin-dependent oxidoreductase (nitroreductase family)